jgi:cytidylate kinase
VDNKGLIIAVDGYAGAGKSSIAKEIAKRLGLTHINSGYIYRAITLYLFTNNIDINNIKNLSEVLKSVDIDLVYKKKENKNIVFLNEKNVTDQLSEKLVEEHVSEVSRIKEVRQKALKIQKTLSEKGSIIMDGRDIGTEVFPNADIKLFVNADIDVRAKRKLLKYEVTNTTLEQVKHWLIKRDIEDETREESPLKKAKDAIEVDNSTLPIDKQVDQIIALIKEKLGEKQLAELLLHSAAE